MSIYSSSSSQLLISFFLSPQGSAVSSRGLATYGLEQWQHHVAHHPSKRQGGPQNPGRRRIHAPGQTNTDLTAPTHGRFLGLWCPFSRLQGQSSVFSLSVLKITFWCYFVIELPSCNERLCGCDYFRAIERQQKWSTAARECNWGFLHKWLIFKPKKNKIVVFV